MKQTMLH